MLINNEECILGVYDLEGNFVTSFTNWEDFEDSFEISRDAVHKYLRNFENRIGALQFRTKIINKVSSKLPVEIGAVYQVCGTKKCKIGKYFNDKLIAVYNSINEAERLTKIQGISQSCVKGCKANGFNFKKIE